VSARALLVGFALATVIGALGPYLGLYVQGSSADGYFASSLAHGVLFLLILLVNPCIGFLRRSWMFNRGELLVIFILMTLGNSAPNMLSYWLPIVSGPLYHASAENNWILTVIPNIPDWLIPHDVEGIRTFFEGADEQTTSVPFDIWLVPVLGWLPVIVAFYLASISGMVILRRQWVEKERLIYPIMQLSLDMVRPDPGGSVIGPFFRNRIMWLGFSVPVIVGTIIGLHAYFPFVPTTDMFLPFPFFSPRLSFATLGFFFLVQRELVLALWVFTVFKSLQVGLYEAIGWGTEAEPVIGIGSYAMPSLVHQSMGAMIILVLGGLWVAREHLLNIARAAFTSAEAEDSDEIMSYRAAFWTLLVSVFVMLTWLVQIGIPLPAGAALLFCTFVVFVALTRIISEGGVAVIYTPLEAPDAALSAIGTSAFGARGLVGLTFARTFTVDMLNFIVPHVASGLKLAGQVEGRKRMLFWGMLVALLLGLSGAFWMLMHLTYTYGAINLRPPNFVWLPNYAFDYTASRIESPSGPSWLGWFHTGIGALIMGLLLLARRLWPWWPIHPIGFPISSTLHWIAFNAFLAWAIKSPVLRYGGVKLYRSIRPFFLGMIMGQFVIFGVFWIVDSCTGMIGNSLFL
jgi:hypothetical protein